MTTHSPRHRNNENRLILTILVAFMAICYCVPLAILIWPDTVVPINRTSADVMQRLLYLRTFFGIVIPLTFIFHVVDLVRVFQKVEQDLAPKSDVEKERAVWTSKKAQMRQLLDEFPKWIGVIIAATGALAGVAIVYLAVCSAFFPRTVFTEDFVNREKDLIYFAARYGISGVAIFLGGPMVLASVFFLKDHVASAKSKRNL